MKFKILFEYIFKKKEGLFILFGILIISYVFYIKVIVTRLPKNLPLNMYNNQQYFLSFVYCILLIVSLYIVYINLRKILGIPYTTKNYMVSKLFSEVTSFTTRSLLTVDHIVKEIIFQENIGEWLLKFSNYLYKNFYNKQLLLYISFFVIPRIIILLAISLDVFIFQQLYYVYKVAFVILIQLLGEYILYSLKKFWRDNKEAFEEILVFTDPETKIEIIFSNYILARLGLSKYKHILEKDFDCDLRDSFLAENKHTKATYVATVTEYLNNFLNIVIPCALFELKYRTYYKERLTPYLLVFLHCLYIIIWSYVLYHGW